MKEPVADGSPTLLPRSSAEALADRAKLKVCVLITVFSRRALTVECPYQLIRNGWLEHVDLSAVLMDDGSTDGTSEAVRSEFPWVEIVRGDGSLFWCDGMHAAWQLARQAGYDYYLHPSKPWHKFGPQSAYFVLKKPD